MKNERFIGCAACGLWLQYLTRSEAHGLLNCTNLATVARPTGRSIRREINALANYNRNCAMLPSSLNFRLHPKLDVEN
eukprot:232219-Pleurochrysis_carterae.AAC.2